MTEQTLTNPALPTLPGADGFRLPPRLLREYTLQRMLPKRGGEAVLLLASRQTDGLDVVLKLYRSQLGLRTNTLDLICRADVEHVVRLYDHSTDAGIGYEVLEYVPAGDLADHVEAHGFPDESQALEIIDELTDAIAALHAVSDPPLAHGDVKPGNVLVRAARPLDLVLTDFGLATLEHDVRHPHFGTPRWSAPGAMSGFHSPEGDWWSLGAIAYWLRAGHELLPDLTEAAAAQALAQLNVDLSDVPPGERDWQVLCQGLLTRDEAERWGEPQVRAWLAGERPEVGVQWSPPPPPVVVTAPMQRPTLRFGGKTFTDLASLGVAMALQWRRTAQTVDEQPTFLTDALTGFAKQTGDLDLATDVRAILEAYEPTALKVSRLVYRLSPEVPPMFQEWNLDRDGLRGLADQAAAHPDSAQALALTDLFTSRALRAWDEIDDLGSGEALVRRWEGEYEYWLSAVRQHGGPTDESARSRAQGRILLALVDEDAAQALRNAAERAAGRCHGVDWFESLAGGARSSAGADLAVVTLAPVAERQADERLAAVRAARRQRAAERHAGAAVRWPRTVRIGWWVLAAQVGLVVCWLALRVAAPRGWLWSPDAWLGWWTQTIPDFLEDWLAWWTDPLVVLPLFAATLILCWRSRRPGGPDADVRHPLERRALQGAILLTCLLIFPLIFLLAIGWFRGLQLYAPASLRRPSRLTLLCAVSGSLASVLTMLLLVGAAPVMARPAITTWPLTGGLSQFLTGPMQIAAFGVWPSSAYTVGAVVQCSAGVVALVASSLAFQRRDPRIVAAMGLAVAPAIVGMLNLPLAYLSMPVGLSIAGVLLVWVLWVLFRYRPAI